MGDAAKQLQLMQKTLVELNLKIHHVFSDIDGVSAKAIIDAILAGERDAERLAALRDRRCRSPLNQIIEALNGSYREEYPFVLQQSQQAWRALQQAIAQCDEKLGQLANSSPAWKAKSKLPCPKPPKTSTSSTKTPRGSAATASSPPGGTFMESI